ncbi:zinc finger protein 34-like isoform X1 [Gadus macrocephalus]|uniref:zinc finger protein 34-like isoform X1 n=2 Tax=Gadus macrocephalus TaxID=80720 RepID=UPI0028CB14C6|nr:zinc finger protein 34-like isoform X1 [Gadus macrocephalus]
MKSVDPCDYRGEPLTQPSYRGGDRPDPVGLNQNQPPGGSRATTMAVNNDTFLDGTDAQLPLASLRLLVPPLRLMSACMWRVAQQRNVQQYGKLAEFVTLVTEMVPELLTPRQMAELVLGLRARFILELVQGDDELDSTAIREQLIAIQLLTTQDTPEEFPDGELGVSKTAFVELVQTFTDKKSFRKKYDFFKNAFPEHYGCRFDTSLQILVWEFLSRLEELLPVSSFVEVATHPDLDSLVPRLEEFGSDTEDLRTLFQHPTRGSAKLEKNLFPFRSAVILSSLASKGTSLTPGDPFSEEGEGAARLQEDPSLLGRSSGRHDRPSVQAEPSGDRTPEDVRLADGGGGGDAQSDTPGSALDGGRSHSCPQCDRAFPRWPDLLEHRCPAAPPPQPAPPRRAKQVYQCERCPRRLVSEGGLQRHLQAHRRGEEPIVCPQCGKTFTHRSSLAVHLRRHSGARPFACSVCGKAFKEKGVLKTHLRVHSPDQPHLCSECGRGFRYLTSYALHLRRHAGVKPFQCDGCARRFFTAQQLKEHGRVHTGERPYACERCEKRFSTKNHLKRHVRVHTGEKPHRCPYCDKGFTQQSNMKNHLRVHRHDSASRKRKPPPLGGPGGP